LVLGSSGIAALVQPANASLPPTEVSADAPSSADSTAQAMADARSSGHRVEDRSQRTETTETFANPDGTWSSEIASEPVRTQDAAGDWHNIDLTLENRDGVVAPKVSAADVTFSDGGDRVLATVSEDGKDLAWRLPNSDAALPAPVLDGATATYPNVEPGQDLVVTATATGFSHSLVLHDRPTPGESVDFALPVSTDGAKLTETAGGGLAVTTKAGDQVVAAPQPLMWDSSAGANGQPENVAPVDVTVTQPDQVTPEGTTAGSSPVVTLSPDESFLTDPDTVYPVVVDPTYTTIDNGDVWAENADFTTGQAGSDELRAGTFDSGSHKARSWLRFDTTPVAGKSITSASLSLLNWWSQTCSGSAIRAARVTSDWVGVASRGLPALTWSNQPSVTYTNAADTSTAKGYSSSCAGGWVSWDVKNIVQGWANGSFANYGFRINAVDETLNSSWRRYRSANYTSNKPTLTVNYTSYPDAPTLLMIGQDPDSNTAWVTPELSAKVTDPDGGSVRARFKIFAGSNEIWSGDGSLVTSGGASEISVPSGVLVPGIAYTVRAYGNDGSLISSGYAAANYNSDDSGQGGAYTALTPATIYSTIGSTPLPPNSDTVVPVLGQGGIPTAGVGAVAMTVTARSWSSDGALTAYNSDELSPGTATVPFAGTDTGSGASATAVVQTGVDGSIKLHNSSTNTVDVTITALGWYTPTDYKPGLSITGDIAPAPETTGSPDDPTPDNTVPVGQISGKFTNGAGNGAAVAGQVVTIMDASPPPDDGTEVAPTIIGATTTASDGTWSYTLPATLPAGVAAEAADNGGVLNLEASVGGATSSGQPMAASQFVTTNVSAPTSVSPSVPDEADPVTSVLPAGSAAIPPTPASVTSSSMASLGQASSDPDPDYAPPAQWQSDQAVTRYAAGTPSCSGTCTQQAYAEGQTNFADASMVPNSSQNLQCDINHCWDDTLDPSVLKRCPVVSRKTVDTAYAYTTVGEGHAYYDAKVSYHYTESTTTGIGAMISANGTSWQLAGSLSSSNQTSVSKGSGFASKGPHWAHQWKVPMKFVKVREQVSCPGLGTDGETVTAYLWVTMSKGFQIPPGGYAGILGKDVSKYDGPAGYYNSNPNWRGKIQRGTNTTFGSGTSVIYNNAASVFGIGVSSISNYGHHSDITMTALNGRYEHDIWGAKGSLNGNPQRIYSY
jgi:hypothetical protein